MKRTLMAAAAAVFALTGGAAMAQPNGHDNDRDHHGYQDNRGPQDNRGQYIHHAEWKRGHQMRHEDWSRGERVDWRSHHLHQPPRGYEWRQVDGNYVMAAVATGLIASIIANSH
jgi:Ni/Co efflux regulator RcnB